MLRGGLKGEAEGGCWSFEGFAAAGLALWSELERLFFIIGFLALDHAMDDTRQLVRGGGGSFLLTRLDHISYKEGLKPNDACEPCELTFPLTNSQVVQFDVGVRE